MICVGRLISVLGVITIKWKLTESFYQAPNFDSNNKLLLILLDGFRWDYFGTFARLPHFDRFRFEGVHAEYMRPVFPSLSYPGYYSILTGLFVESHGFIDNVMYDKQHHMFFHTDTDRNGSLPFWWEDAEPLWTTCQRAGLRTFVYNWPGCHVPIHGILPFYHRRYTYVLGMEQFERDIYDVIHRMRNNEADVGIVYCEYPDIGGHVHGPDSFEMQRVVQQIDNSIGFLLALLDQLQFSNRVNVLIVSDHGMTNVLKLTSVDIAKVVDPLDVAFTLGSGGLISVTPFQGKLDQVYAGLKKLANVYVWKDEEIPEDLHYKHHRRVPPILMAAKADAFILPFPPRDWSKSQLRGHHGWLPSETADMRAIFVARGPDLKFNFEAPPINMVDVYNLMTYLVKIAGNPNNGSWNNVRGMLSYDRTT